MISLRDTGLSAYYFATLPVRHFLLERRSHRNLAPLCILFYHRVADRGPNPWTISHQRFAQQITWLRKHTELISLPELQRRIAQQDSPRLAVHVTFDDGYAENCEYAIPLLIRHRIPCTYFVAWEFIQRQLPFPHDAEHGQIGPPNTLAQLQHMARAGIEIGAHTRTHPNLGKLRDPQRLHDEVVVARDELASAIGSPIRYFAFPYGRLEHLNRDAIDLAKVSGFEGVCAAYGGYNFPGQDPFFLQRIHGDPEFSRFRNWLTLDPRKVGVEPPRSVFDGSGSSFERPIDLP